VDDPVIVRVHSQSTLGDVFHSLRSDSGEQLRSALRVIDEAGCGVLVYLRQEGKGVGLVNEIQSYARQDEGVDAGEGGGSLGFTGDLRLYGVGAQILRALGVRKIRLLTNHPKKIVGLHGYGIEVVEQVPLELALGNHSGERPRETKIWPGRILRSV
jgi:3,4-dihydroxy 2-butanone 4-phosphate synthase/GTP cyclohydrolase II